MWVKGVSSYPQKKKCQVFFRVHSFNPWKYRSIIPLTSMYDLPPCLKEEREILNTKIKEQWKAFKPAIFLTFYLNIMTLISPKLQRRGLLASTETTFLGHMSVCSSIVNIRLFFWLVSEHNGNIALISFNSYSLIFFSMQLLCSDFIVSWIDYGVVWAHYDFSSSWWRSFVERVKKYTRLLERRPKRSK